MKKVIVPALFIAGFFFFSCKQTKFVRHEGFTQGTFYIIKYEIPKKGVSYEREIVQLLRDFSASLSIYQPTTLISRINQNDTSAVVDDYFRTVFNKAAEVNKASDGVFDITVAPLVNFWGFGFTSDKPELNTEKIDSLMQFVGMDKIRIVGDKIVKDHPGVMLDVNAIAKGYSVDVIANFLKSKGCQNYLVNIGGEVAVQGIDEFGNVWHAHIEKPVDNAPLGKYMQALVRLNNRAVATSGNNRRFHVIDGVKYAHTIDVKTGYPVRHNLLSATIVADDCMTADAWATVCLASGLEKSIQLLKQHPELGALLIYSDEKGNFKMYKTEGLVAISL